MQSSVIVVVLRWRCLVESLISSLAFPLTCPKKFTPKIFWPILSTNSQICSQNNQNHVCIIMEHISSRYCLITTITVKFDVFSDCGVTFAPQRSSPSCTVRCGSICAAGGHQWIPVDTSGHQQRNLTMGHCMLHQYSTTTALCVNTELMKLTMPLVQLINQ